MHKRTKKTCCGTRSLLSFAIFLLPGLSSAFSLGPLDVESYLGQPLSARVAVYPSAMENIDDIKVDLGDDSGLERGNGESRIDSYVSKSSIPNMSQVTYSLEKQDGYYFVHFSSTSVIDEPLFSFSVSFSLGPQTIGREFLVSLDPQGFSSPILTDKGVGSSIYDDSNASKYLHHANVTTEHYDSDKHENHVNTNHSMKIIADDAHEDHPVEHGSAGRNFDARDSSPSSGYIFESWNLDYDIDSFADSDNWSELTQDLDAAVLSIDVDKLDKYTDSSSQPAYVVQQGDTIDSIASRYVYPSTTTEDMRDAINRINGSLRTDVEGYLVPGQVVVLPNVSQLNLAAEDVTSSSPNAEERFTKKKYTPQKQKPSYGGGKHHHLKKYGNSKKVSNSSNLDGKSAHHSRKDVVRVEPAVLSSSGLDDVEEDRIANNNKASYGASRSSNYAKIQMLQKEVVRLTRELKEYSSKLANIANSSSSNKVISSLDSKSKNKRFPTDLTASAASVESKVAGSPALSSALNPSGKGAVAPTTPSVPVANIVATSNDDSLGAMLSNLFTLDQLPMIIAVVCVALIASYLLFGRRSGNSGKVSPKSGKAPLDSDTNRWARAYDSEKRGDNKGSDKSLHNSEHTGSGLDGGSHAVSSSVVNPIDEADVYIQYGRIGEAADILKAELEKSFNLDVSLKLAETYGLMGRHKDIEDLSNKILSMHDSESPVWSKFVNGIDKLGLGNYLPQLSSKGAYNISTNLGDTKHDIPEHSTNVDEVKLTPKISDDILPGPVFPSSKKQVDSSGPVASPQNSSTGRDELTTKFVNAEEDMLELDLDLSEIDDIDTKKQ
ncbi:LysM peptidoglycan-binding domain-containing protein [Candidatus Ichthyocystis sparus]|uniref:LysM peptidoglycan-binding domain-containing protein n=1 Tax=Candidatus Ichthyocystis sparus TaxID=1561004 RepID=UPI000B845AEC|nr:LysM peptidoglycan-binding domain-containing protein [Candidatus Ichthyocystis sparus]